MGRQGRILVVDDEPTWCYHLAETLQKTGYHVDAAIAVSEAANFLNQGFYHVLVLDVRMKHSDPSNKEGIELLEELHNQGLTEAIKVIVASQFSTKEEARNVLKEYNAHDVFFKDSFNQEDFLKSVQQAFSTVNPELVIRCQPGDCLQQTVLGLEIDGNAIGSDHKLQQRIEEEVEDLLDCLFYRSTEILVRPLTKGHSGMGVLRVKPFYTNGGGHEVVVKFGDAKEITAEYSHFKEYVQPFLGGGRSTTALDFRRTPHLGGIIYSLLGTIDDQLVDFENFYRQSSIPKIKKALERLFHDTCGGWYANREQHKPLDLANDYQNLLQYNPTELEQLVFSQLSVEGEQKLRFKNLSDGERLFTNPIQAINRHTSIFYPTYRCITHGDFNQHNLLVDSNHHVWMIDFQATGYSHFLRDIAMLDSVVRFQLLNKEDATLQERLQMEEALCTIQRFSQAKKRGNTFATSNQPLAKAHAIVVHLRTLAGMLMYQNSNNDINEYYIALLYHALNTLRFSSLSQLQREHALLSASLLADCLKLDNGKK